MKTLIKTALVAGALALSSFAVTTPASAQSFGFSYSYGNPYGGYYDRGYYGRPYYAPPRYARNCRPVTRVRFDRWGYRHFVRTVVCRPPYGRAYGYYGRGPGYGW
jgi:hypothetical protein